MSFTLHETRNAIQQLPKGKAPGASFLRSEFIRQSLAPAIFRFLSKIWSLGLVPRSWNVESIVPIPKKGDLTRISNYRPISLTENLRKLYERLILPSLTQRIEPLHIYQGGFRKYRGTLDQIASLQETIHLFKRKQKEFGYLCFLDIRAA